MVELGPLGRSLGLLDQLITRHEPVATDEPEEADRVAALCIAAYRANCRSHAVGWRGQTVVAGFVLSRPGPHGGSRQYTCVSLGVGTKFMAPSVARQDPSRELVHDSHAEVLARRGLQRFLHGQLALGVASRGREGLFERRLEAGGVWSLQEGILLHLYTSAAPCGAASLAERGVASISGSLMAKGHFEPSVEARPKGESEAGGCCRIPNGIYCIYTVYR